MVQKALTLKLGCDHCYLWDEVSARWHSGPPVDGFGNMVCTHFQVEDEIQDGYATPLGRIHLAAQ